MTTIKQIHTAVWDFRRKYSEWWATPEPDDCLRYAFTEAGELMDAYLRSQRPGDARNNAKDHSVEKELADVAIMLMSAWEYHHFSLDTFDYSYGRTVSVDDVAYYTVRMMNTAVSCNAIKENSFILALTIVNKYSEQNHIDLLAQVIANLEEIKRKHVPESQWK